MVALFIDGFDKYGGLNNQQGTVAGLVASGDWTTASGVMAIVAPLSSTGFAIQINNGGAISKTLSTNYARLIGGVRFSSGLGGQAVIMQFRDGSSTQCSICAEATGSISLRSGSAVGTILSSGATIIANSVHYLEWDITFSTTGAYQIWLDGVSLFSGTGNTRAGSTNNYANIITPGVPSGTNAPLNIDDLYLFDSTGTANNAVLLTSPRIETTFPVSDSSVQFAFGAATLGSSVPRATGSSFGTTGVFLVRMYIPPTNCTINSVGTVPNITSGASLRGIVYADSAGVAGALLMSGPTVTGTVNNVPLTLPLTTPLSLIGGTHYWVGYMIDSNISMGVLDSGAITARWATAFTFGTSAPPTAPALSAATSNFLFWGNITGVGVNYYEVNQNPSQGSESYVFDSTVGHEDLYGFPALSALPALVYTTAVKGFLSKSDSGSRTISLRMRSGATDGGGSLVGQAVTPVTFGWYSSMFETDPNTGAAWTGLNLNAALSGFRIDS